MTNGQTDKRNKKPDSVGRSDVDPKFVEGVLGPGEIDNEQAFYKLFSNLVSAMTNFDVVEVDRIENLLIQLCLMFRLSKAETKVYQNEQDEAEGVGETLCCYDNGKKGDVVLSLRVVTSVMTRAVMTTYMTSDEKPLDEDERVKQKLNWIISYFNALCHQMKDRGDYEQYCVPFI